MDAQRNIIDKNDSLELNRARERVKRMEAIEDCRRRELELALERVELLRKAKSANEASLSNSNDADDYLSTRSSYSSCSMNSKKGPLKINRMGKNNDPDDADDNCKNISTCSSSFLCTLNSKDGSMKTNKNIMKEEAKKGANQMRMIKCYPPPTSKTSISIAGEKRDDASYGNANSVRGAISNKARIKSIDMQRATLPDSVAFEVRDATEDVTTNLLSNKGKKEKKSVMSKDRVKSAPPRTKSRDDTSLAPEGDCTIFALADLDNLCGTQDDTTGTSEESLDSRAKVRRLARAVRSSSRLLCDSAIFTLADLDSLCGTQDDTTGTSEESLDSRAKARHLSRASRSNSRPLLGDRRRWSNCFDCYGDY